MLRIKQSALVRFHYSPCTLSGRRHRLLLHVKLFNSFWPRRSKVLLSKDRDCDDFLPWLERKAGTDVSSVLSIGKSDYGRTLFAARVIRTGDCILKIPYRAQISPDDIPQELKPLLSDDVGNIAKLAVVILAERKKGQDSDWAPYIRCLPHPEEMHNLIFWNDDELKMIQPSMVYQAAIDQHSQIRKEYLVLKPVLNCFSTLFEDITFEDFKHAYGLVKSRAWESMKGLSLIPFADFLNHDGTTELVVLSDDSMQTSEVIADREYAPGEEVLLRYGKFPNSTLLLDFGFTLPCNIHDQIHIQVDMPRNDHLCALKLEMLRRNHLPATKDVSFNSSGANFLIKEVRSTRGKGKGIPQSLRAFGRVMSCRSAEELSNLTLEATQHDGRLARRPLMNISREVEAHQMLLLRINELVDAYDSSIKSLRLLILKPNRVCGKHPIRRQMALDLLNCEIRVLRSAAEWLKRYCYHCQVQNYSNG